MEGKPSKANLSIQIDSGASVNMLPKKYTGGNLVTPTSTGLQTWNKTQVMPVDETKIEIENPANNRRYNVKFIIIDDDSGLSLLLGSKASQRMNILTINSHNLERVATDASASLLDSSVTFSVTN